MKTSIIAVVNFNVRILKTSQAWQAGKYDL